MFDFTYEAFALADKYRNPVMILADGMLGQMMEPIEFDPKIKPTGVVEKPWALTGAKDRAAQSIKSLLLGDEVLEDHNKKLQRKYRRIEKEETRFESYKTEKADIVIVAYGTMARTACASADVLEGEGIKVGVLRPKTLWPFPYKEIEKLASKGKKFLVVEMSAGQMVEDVKLAVQDKSRVSFYGRMGGGIPTEDQINDEARKIK